MIDIAAQSSRDFIACACDPLAARNEYERANGRDAEETMLTHALFRFGESDPHGKGELPEEQRDDSTGSRYLVLKQAMPHGGATGANPL
jgi:hypothetical protein